MPNEIYLDGQKFTHHTEGLEEMSLTYELKKNIVGYGITDTVEVMKDAYDYLYSVFFADACAGKDAKVDVTVIINSCCLEPQTFTFVLKHQSVKLRALECIIEVELEAENPCQKNYEYLRDTVFWDDGFDQETQYALRYCTQNDNFLLFMWLFQMFFVLLLTMQIIETVISGILNFIITVLFWIGVINKDLKEQLAEALELLLNIPSLDNAMAQLTGCGNFHYASGIKSILEYNITQSNSFGDCTMSLNAPFLEALPYSNLALVNSTEKKGRSCLKANNYNPSLFAIRAYNRTTIQLANEIGEVFGMEVLVLPNGTFTIDTFENIVNGAPVLFNAENKYLNGKAEKVPKYAFDVGKYFAATIYSYSDDSHDTEGNRMLRGTELNSVFIDAQGRERVKYDLDGSTNADDTKNKTFPFGAVRGMFDAETHVRDGFWDVDDFIDFIRSGETISNFGTFTLVPGFVMNALGDEFCLPQNDSMILKKDVTELPKLVLLQDMEEFEDAKMQVTNIDDVNYYNLPLSLDHDAAMPELIQLFHEHQDNPNHPDYRNMLLEPYEVKFDEDMLALVIANGNYVSIQTKYGLGIPTKLEINFKTCTMTVHETLLKCTQVSP